MPERRGEPNFRAVKIRKRFLRFEMARKPTASKSGWGRVEMKKPREGGAFSGCYQQEECRASSPTIIGIFWRTDTFVGNVTASKAFLTRSRATLLP